MSKKHVAVIGAGPAGLVSIKSILEEGHDVTAYEMSPVIGGLWNYDAFKTEDGYEKVEDYDKPIQAIYKSLQLNNSKEITVFSDFPNTEPSASHFLSHWEFRDYLQRYAKNFYLEPHIKLASCVTKLSKGKKGWIVCYENKEEKAEVFHDYIIIAVGFFKFPFMPMIQGMSDSYTGTVLHSSQVRDEAIFKDKKVLVIGAGNSGCEVAIGALHSQVKKLYLCAKKYPVKNNLWIVDRYVKDCQGNLVAWDHLINRYEYFEHPDKLQTKMKSWLHLMRSGDGETNLRFGLDRISVTNVSLLQSEMRSERVMMVGCIDRFSERSVYFTDGSTAEDIDFVVMATGYLQRFPFLDDLWSAEDQGKCELYKYMLHPDRKMDGLAFVCASPAPFPIFPIMEMQARWIAQKLIPRAYNEDGELFNEAERQFMRTDIDTTREAQLEGLPYNFVVDSPSYYEKLAKEIGCEPPCYTEDLMRSGTVEERELAVALRYGTMLSTHYRIRGPHRWDGAKEWIVQEAKRLLGQERFSDYMKI